MKFEQKGMLGPFTIITSFITGAIFPLLGSLIALDVGLPNTPYIEGIVLVMLGGFLAHWILSHTIHDLIHLKLEDRHTYSKKTLQIMLLSVLAVLFCIALYLSWRCGWPVMVFAIIGAIVSVYAEGYIHHESQMAFGAMFLVIGGFYVQAKTLDLGSVIWIKVIMMSLFAFFSQYGWLLFYRLDDYKYNVRVKNRSILITKVGLFFLLVYLFI